MIYHYQRADTAIASQVRSVLVLQPGVTDEQPNVPLFTNGSPAFVCRLGQGVASLALYGQAVTDEALDTDEDTTVVAFFFKPFAMACTFGIAAKYLKDNPVINLPNWNAQLTFALQLQLSHATTLVDKIGVLTAFIAACISRQQRDCEVISHATDRIMNDPDTEILATLLTELNLTERTFQRIFKKYVGTTPIQYRRICQFYFAFSQLRGDHYERLSDVAYSNGYFDQSHYIRAFKEFTDITPNEYLQHGLTKK
ncbi:MAG TPA: AraC family transcriptional regulator [Flavipsychrobacter sp.]